MLSAWAFPMTTRTLPANYLNLPAVSHKRLDSRPDGEV